MKKDFIMPLVVLSCICLFISGALSLTNNVTRPVIEAAATERAETARRDILPNAERFIPIEAGGLPRAVTEVFGTTNNVGYLFMVTTNGYGGEVKFIVGIDSDGKIIDVVTLESGETVSFAARVLEGMVPKFIGSDKSLSGVDAITGATLTSNAYLDGVRAAFEAFEMVKGVR